MRQLSTVSLVPKHQQRLLRTIQNANGQRSASPHTDEPTAPQHSPSRQVILAVQQPRLALPEWSVREAQLVAHLDAVVCNEQRERRDALHLREPASDAPA